MARSTKAMTLFQRLGALDKERREIIDQIRKTPEYGIQFLKQALAVLLVEHKGKWYSRQNDKNQTAYFKIISLEQVPLTKSVSLPKGTSKKRGNLNSDMTFSKNKAVLAKIKVEWAVWGFGAVELTKSIEEIDISVFKDIATQILNGRTIAKNFDEKAVMRTTFSMKKKQLEAEIQKLNDQIALLK